MEGLPEPETEVSVGHLVASATQPHRIRQRSGPLSGSTHVRGDEMGRRTMTHVEWRIKGREFANCNCSYGCPCQFNAPPTHGDCRAAVGWQIDQGVFGTVKLDGLRAAGLYTWPKAVHEGNGTMQLIVDERAKPEQREALLKIMTGQETAEMATMWWVYAAMSPNKLEPLFKPIEFEADVDGRRAP